MKSFEAGAGHPAMAGPELSVAGGVTRSGQGESRVEDFLNVPSWPLAACRFVRFREI